MMARRENRRVQLQKASDDLADWVDGAHCTEFGVFNQEFEDCYESYKHTLQRYLASDHFFDNDEHETFVKNSIQFGKFYENYLVEKKKEEVTDYAADVLADFNGFIDDIVKVFVRNQELIKEIIQTIAAIYLFIKQNKQKTNAVIARDEKRRIELSFFKGCLLIKDFHKGQQNLELKLNAEEPILILRMLLPFSVEISIFPEEWTIDGTAFRESVFYFAFKELK
jgi:hypothetical protein